MIAEQQLREKLRKISALFEGATTPGERNAAAAAIDRVKQALAGMLRTEQPTEMQFSLPDRWQRRLFMALCRPTRVGSGEKGYHFGGDCGAWGTSLSIGAFPS